MPTSSDWDDLAQLLGSGRLADLFSAPVTPPAERTPVFTLAGVQMVLDRPPGNPGVRVPAVAELGTAGALLAMAGERRLRQPGWAEISSVCTARA